MRAVDVFRGFPSRLLRPAGRGGTASSWAALVAAMLSAQLAVPTPAYATPGVVATTVTTDIGSSTVDAAFGVALGLGSDIVAAGRSGSNMAVARYNRSPLALDTTFNVTGKLIGATAEGPTAVVMDGDDTLVASSPGTTFRVNRYNPDGTPDGVIPAPAPPRSNSFEGDGDTWFTGLPLSAGLGHAARVGAIALQQVPAGTEKKIIVAGTAIDSFEQGESRHFVLVRFNENGAPDLTFGVNGQVHTSVERECVTTLDFCPDGTLGGMAIDSLGRIVVAGSIERSPTNADFVIARYLPNGILDPSFGTVGLSYVDYGSAKMDRANGLVIQSSNNQSSNNKIIVVGESDEDFAAACLGPDGAVDQMPAPADLGGIDRANDVATMSDGGLTKHVAVGGSGGDFAVARYKECVGAGSFILDTTFDADGAVTTDIALSSDAVAHAAVIEPVTGNSNDTLMVAGQSGDNFALVRYALF